MLKNKSIIYLAFFSFCLTICFAEDGKFVYNSKGKRNPFIPLVTSDGRLLKLDKAEVSGPLAVEGIVFDKSGVSYAVVNGNVVGVGDFISDYQVLKVEAHKVIFIKDGIPKEVELTKEGE